MDFLDMKHLKCDGKTQWIFLFVKQSEANEVAKKFYQWSEIPSELFEDAEGLNWRRWKGFRVSIETRYPLGLTDPDPNLNQ